MNLKALFRPLCRIRQWHSFGAWRPDDVIPVQFPKSGRFITNEDGKLDLVITKQTVGFFTEASRCRVCGLKALRVAGCDDPSIQIYPSDVSQLRRMQDREARS